MTCTDEISGKSNVVLLAGGFVKVTTAVEGFETLLGIRVPGEVIGEIGALTGSPRNATVTACGTVYAGTISRAASRRSCAGIQTRTAWSWQ
jgi:CRP/FNR family transcriptional regulator, cyclic AMP receptor protein